MNMQSGHGYTGTGRTNNKRWILCADGTWNGPHQTDQGIPSPTNVAKLAAAVQPHDHSGKSQVVYYHPGLGERGGVLDHVLGGALGLGLSKNVTDLYLFLVLNYVPGDELFLFGFSRGAYTVRSLAGLIRNSGVLKNAYAAKFKEAFDLYRDRSDASHPSASRAREFRHAFSWPDFNIKFIGVWDTVGALGIPFRGLNIRKFEFHDVELSSHVDYAYQALAIDEKRKPFSPTLWTKQATSPESQVLEQVWFSGVHSNIGGGYKNSGLSDCALHWMWRKAASCGLALNEINKPVPDPKGELRDPMEWYYKLLGDGTRRLGTLLPVSHEQLSRTAITRKQLLSDYKPINMLEFLKFDPIIQDV